MSTKQTTLRQIGFTPNGTLEVQFGLVKTDDDGEVTTRWHRTSFPPGTDVDAQIGAVNAHLAQPLLAADVPGGYPAIPAAAVDQIKANADAMWTPEVLAAYQAFLAGTA